MATAWSENANKTLQGIKTQYNTCAYLLIIGSENANKTLQGIKTSMPALRAA